jgi:hypothetical protein
MPQDLAQQSERDNVKPGWVDEERARAACPRLPARWRSEILEKLAGKLPALLWLDS